MDRGEGASGAAGKAWKVLLVGDEQVGKSSLLRRFHNGAEPAGAAAPFTSQLPPTFSIDFLPADVETPSGETRRLHVYDTPGREEFRHNISGYYRGMHGLLIVFDLCSAASFASAERWCDPNTRPPPDALTPEPRLLRAAIAGLRRRRSAAGGSRARGSAATPRRSGASSSATRPTLPREGTPPTRGRSPTRARRPGLRSAACPTWRCRRRRGPTCGRCC